MDLIKNNDFKQNEIKLNSKNKIMCCDRWWIFASFKQDIIMGISNSKQQHTCRGAFI